MSDLLNIFAKICKRKHINHSYQKHTLQIIDKMDESSVQHPKYWMPLVWAGAVVMRARKEGRIKDDYALKTLVEHLDIYRGKAGALLEFDWISIPLVYTQVKCIKCFENFLEGT